MPHLQMTRLSLSCVEVADALDGAADLAEGVGEARMRFVTGEDGEAVAEFGFHKAESAASFDYSVDFLAGFHGA